MQAHAQNLPTSEQIVEYWLADSEQNPQAAVAQKARWYRGGPAVDADISARYADAVDAALQGSLAHWRDTPTGALGLVILLDQFTRTLFRGTAKAFAGDPAAMKVAEAAIESGHDRALSVPGRIFLYHPFHHAETVAAQDRGIALVRAMLDDYPAIWHDYITQSVEGFTRHRNLVAEFNRFPHRNAVLGRQSSAAEQAYLDSGAERFGQ